MPRSYCAPEFRASVALTYLGGFFAYGVAMSALYAGLGVGLPCPFRWVTGWDCPLCGATRMGSSLLHLNVAAAFAYNPLVLVALVGLGVLGVVWLVEVLGGPVVRPPHRWADRLARVHPTQWLVSGLAVAVVYTITRNIS